MTTAAVSSLLWEESIPGFKRLWHLVRCKFKLSCTELILIPTSYRLIKSQHTNLSTDRSYLFLPYLHLTLLCYTMADQVKNAAGSAGNSWNAMSEDQKKQTFDSLPQDKKQGKSYMEWVKEGYHNQYENWMPWIEDQYLKWFTNDNKASYAAKG